MRLIDADELLTAFPVDDEPTLTKSCVRMTIKNMPTIEQRKKGRWITSHVPESMLWECNQCGYDCGAHSFNYCPMCGADMRGEDA